MKPLFVLGFALTVSFLAPLAQAAPAGSSEPPHVDAPAPAVFDDRRADPPLQAEPEHHDPDRQPHGDSAPSAPPFPEHHRQDAQPVFNVVQAPAVDDSQDSTPVYDEQATAPIDDSCGNSEPGTDTAHYTIEDLANAAASLDELTARHTFRWMISAGCNLTRSLR
jgi:hypothetical protein